MSGIGCEHLGHRTGCACAIGRGLTHDQAKLEDAVRAGGEQGPEADEIEIDRLRAENERLRAALQAALDRCERECGPASYCGRCEPLVRALGLSDHSVMGGPCR